AAMLVWVAIHRMGPCTREQLAEAVSGVDLEAALERLLSSQRVHRKEEAGRALYIAHWCIIPFGDEAGWEGGVFDHYQAVVTAITTKLHHAQRAEKDDTIGGSTYAFDIWPGHPSEARVLGLLRDVRRQATELREIVDAHNAAVSPPERVQRVTFYV